MVRLREFDREEVLLAAMRVFWEKGYEAASLNDLTSAMAIQRPSLYLAFGDKEQLFEQALRKYTQWHASTLGRSLIINLLSKMLSNRILQIWLMKHTKGKSVRGASA